jgi:hypothetical protein
MKYLNKFVEYIYFLILLFSYIMQIKQWNRMAYHIYT